MVSGLEPAMHFVHPRIVCPHVIVSYCHDQKYYIKCYIFYCFSYAKITCVVIRGFVKGSLYKIGKPLTNDQLAEWNSVFVDGSWRLLDPFWGACSQNSEGDVTSDTVDWFLFTEPRQFLYSHFPETPQWQLVEQPITQQEFESQVKKTCPVGIWCQNDVVLKSMQRHHVASTFTRRHFYVMRPLG